MKLNRYQTENILRFLALSIYTELSNVPLMTDEELDAVYENLQQAYKQIKAVLNRESTP